MYTIAEESKYVQIDNVPPYNLENELRAELSKYGTVDRYYLHRIEENTQIRRSNTEGKSFFVAFATVFDAKKAKKAMHKCSFFGFPVEFRYLPEKESVSDTFTKLTSKEAELPSELPPPRCKLPPKPRQPSPQPTKRRRI